MPTPRSRLLGLAALACLFGLLGFGEWSAAKHCREAKNCSDHQRAAHEAPNSQHEETLWERTTNDPIAFYTFLLAVLTGGLVIASTVQGYFLIRADRTARTAADAALKTAETAEQTAILSLRAFIAATPQKFMMGDRDATTITEGNNYTLVTSLGNMGRTPAYDVEVYQSWHNVPRGEGLPIGFRYEAKMRTPPPHAQSFRSKVTLPPFSTMSHTMSLNQEEVSNLVRASAGILTCYIYGHVDYIDIFHRKRTTPFCYGYDTQARPGMSPFTAYREHNTPTDC